jgi:prolipoprotein diacylglyceryltransferase
VGLLLIHWFRQKKFEGQIFAWFMMFYGTFRFLTEFIRETDKSFAGMSAYQYFALLLLLAGMASFIARARFKRNVIYG